MSQSVAGAPLAGSMPPAPAERPPAGQASWATFARCRKGRYTLPLASGKIGVGGKKVHQGFLGATVNINRQNLPVTVWLHWENRCSSVNAALEWVV
ncbi:hypothetical protein, partial [Xenorhabdus koppenhoeferi]|uniref:hypothetical protein n=1 Tax=Xenorhabdus koppenhoeferi TaxID=351659 RepID=UPI002B414C31